MIRFRLLAALAVLFVAPGAAQVTRPLPVITPMTASPQALPRLAPMEVDNDPITKVMTLEEANALIAKLKNERREKSIELKNALDRIDQMTKFGGSLVSAYCEGITMSRNTAGASENCAASGYNCDKVSGTCFRQATMGDHCAPNFNLDPASKSCVPATTPPVEL